MPKAEPHPLAQLRLSDVLTFVAVRRLGSMSSASRELRVSPSQVSKAIARLEELMQVKLLERRERGVSLAEGAAELADQLEHVLGELGALRAQQKLTPATPPLTIAGQSFLLQLVLPRLARRLPGQPLRGVELAASAIGAFVASGLFDLGITSGARELPRNWESVTAGRLRYGLFMSPATAKALPARVLTPAQAQALPFIVPMVLLNGQLVEAEDRCPLHLGERRVLHRVPNLSVGLDLAASCEAAIFGPALVAQPLVAAGDLVEVQVRDWAVEDPISIICAAERVRSRVQAAALAEVSALLAAPQGNSR